MNSIKLNRKEYIAEITLSKKPLNILGIDELNQLSYIINNLNKEKELKLVLIKSDQKVFSAGINIEDHKKDKVKKLLKAFHNVFYAMLDSKIPILSILKSECYGGGCELALFSDLVIASDKAVFSFPEINLGCYPPVAVSFLSSIIGNKKALEVILTGNKFSAKDAFDWGLINQVFKEDEIDENLDKYIKKIVFNSSSVINTTMKVFKIINRSELKEKIAISEKIYLEELVELEDSEEGLKSFFEKRTPVWKEK